MVVKTPTALSDRKQQLLNLIPGRELGYILKRPGIKKDLIIGLIGERGGGKSGSGAVLSLVDFAMDGIPLYSNMNIALDLEVDDVTAQKYGFKTGGVARYRSIPIDMPKLLRFNEMYRGSVIFLDEVNVEVSESRRAMSNTNLFSNRLTQELRHLESSIIFTCISEMAVDPRWRDVVDCYIRSEETAYYTENIAAGKPIGVDFKWSVYLMNRCFNGRTYAQTKTPEKEAIFHFMPWRGIYDDKEFQGAGMTKYGVNFQKENGEDMAVGNLKIEDSPIVADFRKTWGWFEPIAEDLLSRTDRYVPAYEIWDHPEVRRRKIAKNDISTHLKQYYNVVSRVKSFDGIRGTYYELPDEILEPA